ncbi:[NiFe]-hydrogenase assembly chaperone HybE [Hydrogenophaga sp.]|uniref:[NiFe]-hydrogenase assembly chaperone HybE n=1 Tax=Hydrogenophaga sp. TaxID=1904254 RepID=UPI00271E455D|nr:[NiFe]-hydrogenase assembly chaperone HybE [Hydrogenophaga sp.]MDO8905038.1 [NiFe]-hydrogenase assembly chaperone HybE [Hydrogenophaga sp.]
MSPLDRKDMSSASPAQLAARVQSLVDFYRHVQHERMQGIPLMNPVLQVEAVGFEWAFALEEAAEPVAEGILITPWFMSLLRLPAIHLPHGNRVGRKAVRDFGSECFDFIGAHDPAVGYHETCALFSPMNGFPSQDLARETAMASLALVRPTRDAPEVASIAAEPLPPRRAFFMARRPDAGTAL